MSNFKKLWINQGLEKFKNMYPDKDEDKLKDFLDKVYDRDIKDKEVILYNNYEQEEVKTTVTEFIGWIDKTKPLLTESGTLFKQHDQSYNPDTKIISGLLDERKIAKKKKFKYLTDAQNAIDDEQSELMDLVKKYDLMQIRKKVAANSEYGASGLPSSWFFNIACATATTLRGQTLISTAMCCFENFLADNIKFLNMDEMYIFVNNILKEKPLRKKSDIKWVESKSVKDVVDRLIYKFHDDVVYDENKIIKYIKHLDQEDLNRIYYKCNLYEFFNNSKKARNLLRYILLSDVDYYDPIKPDKVISDECKKLKDALLEYVDYSHPIQERAYRLKTQVRKGVITIDTDSNFLNFGPWCDYCIDTILKEYDPIKISRKKKHNQIDPSKFASINTDSNNKQSLCIKATNTLVYTITDAIANTLDVFLKHANVQPEYRSRTGMKNEFYYKSILLTPAKKHYMGAQLIQEGVIFKNPELDIKGMDFKKPSYASKETRDTIEKMLYNEILCKNGNIDISRILKTMSKFEKRIEKSIYKSEFTYLKTANVKTEDAYTDPLSTGSYKAVYTWNYIHPDMTIELPSTVYLLKLNITKEQDIIKLKSTYPEIYDKLCYLLALYNKGKATSSGIKNIAIPKDSIIPDWVLPYINMDEIKSNNTKLAFPILNSLGIKTIHKVASVPYYSNIIRL